MNNIRVSSRLIITNENHIKGVHLEKLRKMKPSPKGGARCYQQGIDEHVYTDVIASLYGRNNIFDTVSQTAQNVFIPITVGDNALKILGAGGNKTTISTAAVVAARHDHGTC